MATFEQRQIELLEVYWRRVDRDPAAVPPDGLDPAIAALAQQLQHLGHATMGGGWRPPPWPPAAATGEVGRQRGGDVAVPGRRLPAFRPGHLRWRRILPGLATVAALTLALVVGVAIWGAHPRPVSAQEILRQAVAATAGPPSQVRSFVLTETRDDRTAQGQLHSEARFWYQAPDRWRTEYSARLGAGPLGQGIVVSDGSRVWDYRLPQDVVRVIPIADAQGIDAPPSPGAIGASAGSLADVLRRAGACNAPTLRGSAAVLGRETYVIDTGLAACSTPEPPADARRLELWIDKQTFFPLKAVQYGTDGAPLVTIEVTSLQLNVPIEASRFAFTVPPGATVQGAQASPTAAATSGQAAAGPAFMGVGGVANTSGFAAQYGIPDQPGLVVIDVLSGSPAARAGIRAKDLVRTVADQPVGSEGDLARILAHHRPGDTVAVTVLRGDTTRTFTVTLGAVPPPGQ